MALQHYFVVFVEGNTLSTDYEVSINYDAGRTWDTEAEDWLDYDSLTDEGEADLQRAADLLDSIVERVNNAQM